MIQILYRYFARRLLSPPVPLRVITLLIAVLSYGATGFLYFEGPTKPSLGWYDGIWYALVTITTIGYGDLYPVTTEGRFLVAGPLMFFGIGLLGYVLSIAASSLVESKTKELRGMSDFRLEGHLVIFNFPSVAKVERLLDELAAAFKFGPERRAVLVDEDLLELPVELVRRELLFVRGNPTREETLQRASIDKALYAIVLSKKPGDPHSDDLNVAVTLAVESKKRRLHTVVECVDFTTQELLRKAGCDGIVCTSRFDAHFLSHELLNPGVQEVVDMLTSNLKGQQIRLTEFHSRPDTTYADLRKRCAAKGHQVIGLQRESETLFNLEADHRIEPGDRVITIGPGALEI